MIDADFQNHVLERLTSIDAFVRTICEMQQVEGQMIRDALETILAITGIKADDMRKAEDLESWYRDYLATHRKAIEEGGWHYRNRSKAGDTDQEAENDWSEWID
jgi:hypothetical protein